MSEIFTDTALIAAVIGGIVAFAVTMITEASTTRREERMFLTQKLEELYNLVNDAGEKNVEYWNLYRYLESDLSNVELGRRLGDFQIYASALQKRIVLYVRLYFPALSAAHISLFQSLSRINHVLYGLLNGTPTRPADVDRAFLSFGDHLRAFEQEIVDNKPILVGRRRLRFKYKKAQIVSPWKGHPEGPDAMTSEEDAGGDRDDQSV